MRFALITPRTSTIVGLFLLGLLSMTTVQGAPPRFEISPLVQDLDCRPGQTESFEFLVKCHSTEAAFRVEPVRMTQNEEGLMAPSVALDDPNLELLSPSIVRLTTGEETTIRGRVRAPLAAGAFVPLGILVTQISDEDLPAAKGTGAGIGARFISRYLLRVELRTTGGLGRQRSLVVESATVEPSEAGPMVQAFVTNPTDDALEFALRAIIKKDGVPYGRPAAMALPIRASDPVPRRNEARVLGGTRVRMETKIDRALPAGNYDLELMVSWHGRDYQTVTAPFTLEERAANPTTENRMLCDGVSLSEAQLTLSAERGGRRLTTLTLENARAEPVTVRLTASDCDWLLIRPDVIVLPPRQSRSVMVALTGASPAQPEYATVDLQASYPIAGGKTETGRRSLVVANLVREAPTPNLNCGRLAIDPDSKMVQLLILNTGAVHVSPKLDITLRQADKIITTWTKYDSAWLLPGEQREFEFPAGDVPAGIYEYAGTVRGESEKWSQPLIGELVIP